MSQQTVKETFKDYLSIRASSTRWLGDSPYNCLRGFLVLGRAILWEFGQSRDQCARTDGTAHGLIDTAKLAS
ncbi:hypothetical protein RRG08_049230 [Elysia crispata]|uniref:Uncharacterized protein n=1 Tax=Elysia crispata TaxID=231223 RepID=A0AAE0YTV3_9GAST|nr:hypothetical protein RRG08_049230 [Elysia crispata]